jgi:hypothetical protein
MSLGAAWRRVSGHFGSPDPRIAACNTVALIVVGNQPFYPFYVWYAAGAPVGAAYLTWLSTPFFVAAPWLARRHSLGGRVMLLCASLGNTVLAAGALGPASGVELFYLPCLVLSFIGFGSRERRTIVPGAVAVAATGLALVRQMGGPLAGLSGPQDTVLLSMHAISVACLLAVMGLMAFRMRPVRSVSRSGA